jgi:hypothetical protein
VERYTGKLSRIAENKKVYVVDMGIIQEVFTHGVTFPYFLITSNSTTGTPLKGSYTVTLNSLGLVEGNATTLPSSFSLPPS